MLVAAIFLGGAAWFAALAGYSGGIALGFVGAHGFGIFLATVVLTPAVLGCAVALLDGGFALLRRRDGAGRWTRILVEAAAALVFAAFATVISVALWPGVAALALLVMLAFVGGLLRWRPAEVPTPAGVPRLLLLLDEGSAPSGAPRPVIQQQRSEDEAA